MLEKVRFGIIGAGTIAIEGHIPAIKDTPGAELVAICRRNREKAKKLAEEFGVPEVYYDYRDLVKSKNVDAIIVATPNAYHRENTIAAAEEGKHVLCEKPMATNLKDAKEMIRVCRENKVKLQIGFNQRFFNHVEIVKKMLEENVIGEVKAFNTTYREGWDLYPVETDYRNHADLSGGACLIDLGIHKIDLVRYLLGDFKEICAEVKHSAMPAKLDDNAFLLCNLNNGITGCISSDRFSPAVDGSFSIFGTEGMIYFNAEIYSPFGPSPLSVYIKRSSEEIPDFVQEYFYPQYVGAKPEKSWINITPSNKNPYQKQIEDFCQSLLKDKEPSVSGEDGLRALEVVLAAYKSAKERRWISLPLKEDIVSLPSF
ncbi:MAG TPA: Gfo/Idh/MocA family oxidoreductase [Candidatus Aerophobetes bacterium]|uniref:Gfo/Idh/MocA family oxidoreductase n=1 Tax=Aerophobetes bacterium TaxID=2030807 RepID=A0A7V0MZ14_UNCAE|nr:Gfo/Idh/MocA family oxidoreductase [Candidatus Aerophobetes bacterium]